MLRLCVSYKKFNNSYSFLAHAFLSKYLPLNSSQIVYKKTTSSPTHFITINVPCVHSLQQFVCCKENKNKNFLVRVFGTVIRQLQCYPFSWSACNCLVTREHPLSTANYNQVCRRCTSRGFFGRRMSIIHLLTGQSLKPGLLFSTSKFPRHLSSKASSSMTLRYDVASVLCNQPWNSAANARHMNWLLARHSAWLLFGICTCSIAAGTGTLGGPPALAEPLVERPNLDEVGSNESPVVTAATDSHGKRLLTNYSVIGIPGDGRCLFRAVAHGAHLRKGQGAPSESLQRESADVLRGKVVDELVKRREETEWFIEGDFDSYTRRMREPHVWGGEPELLMASHVLRMPITVYMFEHRSRGLMSIAEYGQEYAKECPVPIRVLYHGFGHYDALQLPSHEI